MKSITAVIFSVAIVLAAFFLGNAYVERANPSGTVNVTGSGSQDFTSDLIVWEGRFVRTNKDLTLAFEELENDKNLVQNYLTEKGVASENIVFNSVQTQERNKQLYQNGNYIGTEFLGYELSQTIKIESTNVDHIEEVAREITELLNQGVQFHSMPPRYYYRKIADLKIELISQATEDAKLRAEKIAGNSGSELGKLKSADLGVFQITGQNSGEDYSWSGAFNTADKNKTATITVRLSYEID